MLHGQVLMFLGATQNDAAVFRGSASVALELTEAILKELEEAQFSQYHQTIYAFYQVMLRHSHVLSTPTKNPVRSLRSVMLANPTLLKDSLRLKTAEAEQIARLQEILTTLQMGVQTTTLLDSVENEIKASRLTGLINAWQSHRASLQALEEAAATHTKDKEIVDSEANQPKIDGDKSYASLLLLVGEEGWESDVDDEESNGHKAASTESVIAEKTNNKNNEAEGSMPETMQASQVDRTVDSKQIADTADEVVFAALDISVILPNGQFDGPFAGDTSIYEADITDTEADITDTLEQTSISMLTSTTIGLSKLNAEEREEQKQALQAPQGEQIKDIIDTTANEIEAVAGEISTQVSAAAPTSELNTTDTTHVPRKTSVSTHSASTEASNLSAEKQDTTDQENTFQSLKDKKIKAIDDHIAPKGWTQKKPAKKRIALLEALKTRIATAEFDKIQYSEDHLTANTQLDNAIASWLDEATADPNNATRQISHLALLARNRSWFNIFKKEIPRTLAFTLTLFDDAKAKQFYECTGKVAGKIDSATMKASSEAKKSIWIKLAEWMRGVKFSENKDSLAGIQTKFSKQLKETVEDLDSTSRLDLLKAHQGCFMTFGKTYSHETLEKIDAIFEKVTGQHHTP